MDTTKAVTHVSLCAGYGGIDLGLKRAIPDLRTIAFAEIEAFACANLVAKMEAGQLDPAPIWTDLKTFPWSSFRGKVGILSGGYPCQPFSAAGKRLGKDDPRHLWPWIADGIRVCRPAVCFFENVEGHISLGLREVIGELEEIGYRATWGVFSAAEVGAPHQRKRVFILSDRKDSGLEGHWRFEQSELRNDPWPSRPGQPQFPWEPPRVVGDTNGMGSLDDKQSTEGRRAATVAESSAGLGDTESQRSPAQRAKHEGFGGELCSASSSSESESNGRQTEPSLGGDADGSAGGMDYAQLCISGDSRVDELRLLGNGVVPATAERAFNVLASRLFS